MKKYRVFIIAAILAISLGSFGAGIISAWTDRSQAVSHYSIKTLQAKAKTALQNTASPLPTVSAESSTSVSAGGIYAALGDSIAAGQGLPLSPNATAQDKQCGRSPDTYAATVASTKGLTLIHGACSGATAGDLFTKQAVSGPNIPPQLDAAFAQGTPKLITITAGANDVHWAGFLRKCYAVQCGSKFDKTAMEAYRGLLEAKLVILFYDIQRRSHGSSPDIIMTGYYNPLSAQCMNVQPQLTSSELAWINSELAALNQTLRRVSTDFPNVSFVPVSFNGHDVCSADSWVQGPNDPAPFHPTKKGQDAIARAILGAL